MKFKSLKKVGAIIASLALVIGVMGTSSYAALEDGTYKVPVHLKKAVEESDSMGAKALEENAIVTVKDGKPEVKVYFKGLSFMNMYGHIKELFYYPKGVDLTSTSKGTPTQAEVIEEFEDEGLQPGVKETFPRAFKIPREDTDETYIPIRVMVDAMASIAESSGQEGRGEQDARLMIDYTRAEKTEEAEMPAATTKNTENKNEGNDTKKTNNTKNTGSTTSSSSNSSNSSTPSSSGTSSAPASSTQKSSSDNASTPDELPKTGSLLNTRGVALASMAFIALGLLIRKKAM
ncbi:MAG: NEAT domain-containing protein [Andreesenia angusta]|nr:NEAT domain-containing protein [Andreesenia angusta]